MKGNSHSAFPDIVLSFLLNRGTNYLKPDRSPGIPLQTLNLEVLMQIKRLYLKEIQCHRCNLQVNNFTYLNVVRKILDLFHSLLSLRRVMESEYGTLYNF
jgi:hypothetical protein